MSGAAVAARVRGRVGGDGCCPAGAGVARERVVVVDVVVLRRRADLEHLRGRRPAPRARCPRTGRCCRPPRRTASRIAPRAGRRRARRSRRRRPELSRVRPRLGAEAHVDDLSAPTDAAGRRWSAGIAAHSIAAIRSLLTPAPASVSTLPTASSASGAMPDVLAVVVAPRRRPRRCRWRSRRRACRGRGRRCGRRGAALAAVEVARVDDLGRVEQARPVAEVLVVEVGMGRVDARCRGSRSARPLPVMPALPQAGAPTSAGVSARLVRRSGSSPSARHDLDRRQPADPRQRRDAERR